MLCRQHSCDRHIIGLSLAGLLLSAECCIVWILIRPESLRLMLCCLQENLWHWMMDPRGRDQFVIRYQDATEICWNDAQRTQAEEVYKRSFWTESFVGWSPHGSYLATMHRQGIALWGGTLLLPPRPLHPPRRAP